jgi:hypothetical protein
MDIVERLRTLTVYNWHTVTEIDKEEVLTPLFFFVNQAADEIERLREALQWAIKDCDAKTNHESMKRELLEALGEKK